MHESGQKEQAEGVRRVVVRLGDDGGEAEQRPRQGPGRGLQLVFACACERGNPDHVAS